MGYSWHPIQDQVKRDPGQGNKVPVQRVYHNTNSLRAAKKPHHAENGNHGGADSGGNDVKKMKTGDGPHQRSVNVFIPAEIEGLELLPANEVEAMQAEARQWIDTFNQRQNNETATDFDSPETP